MNKKHLIKIVTKTNDSTNTTNLTVTDREAEVISILVSSGPLAAPAIVKESDGKLNITTIYKLLNVLLVKELVERGDDTTIIGGSEVKRVLYKVVDGIQLQNNLIKKPKVKVVNLTSIPKDEQECLLSSFWSMLGDLEHLADSKEASIILRHDVGQYYQQWNRVTGDNKKPIWERRKDL